MCKDFDIPTNLTEYTDHLRKKYEENAHLKDIRVIGMLLVVKGQQDLKEVVEHWKSPTHIMEKW